MKEEVSYLLWVLYAHRLEMANARRKGSMSQLPRVVIILVNWNGYNDTVACLESLRHLYYSNYSVIVVDNNSADGSETKLRKNYPQHTVLQSSSNLGFAGGCNLGIQRALNGDCDYVLLLNNDIEVEPNLVSELVQFSDSDEKIGITSGKIYFTELSNQVWCYGGAFNVNTGSAKHFLNEQEASQPLEKPFYLYLPGCLWLLKRKCIESAGLLSEKFFHLVEDVEYCIRVQQKGWELALTSKAIAHHKGSASMKRMSPIYNYYEQRNRLYVIQQYQIKKSFLFQIQDFCVIAARLCLIVFLGHNLKEIWQNVVLITRAVYDFFSGRSGKQF